jgi:hypothetical protein
MVRYEVGMFNQRKEAFDKERRQRILVHATKQGLLDASLWVCLCIPLSLLGNNSVKTFSRHRKVV